MARRKTDKPIQVPLSPSEYAALQAEAGRQQVSMNQIVRVLLSEHIPGFVADERREWGRKSDGC